MRRTSRSLELMILLGVGLSACSTEDGPKADGAPADPEPSADRASKEAAGKPGEPGPGHFTTLEELKTRTAVVVDGKTYYNVEWDMYLDEAGLSNYYRAAVEAEEKAVVITQPSTGQDKTFTRNTAALNVRYCVSTSFSNYATAVSEVAQATHAWELVANVRFNYVSTADTNCVAGNSAIDVAIFPTTAISGACGTPPYLQASALSAWCPFALGTLAMNYGAFPLAGYPNITTVGVFRHELGHILGLRHEHPWAPSGGGCAEAQSIGSPTDLGGRQLTAYDQNSVMHYPWCGGNVNSDLSITFLDGEGVRQLYGIPAAWYGTLRLGL